MIPLAKKYPTKVTGLCHRKAQTWAWFVIGFNHILYLHHHWGICSIFIGRPRYFGIISFHIFTIMMNLIVYDWFYSKYLCYWCMIGFINFHCLPHLLVSISIEVSPFICSINSLTCLPIQRFPKMRVITPKSSILMGFSIRNHHFGDPPFMETPICSIYI